MFIRSTVIWSESTVDYNNALRFTAYCLTVQSRAADFSPIEPTGEGVYAEAADALGSGNTSHSRIENGR